MSEERRKLNLGCGTDLKPGWVNQDLVDMPGVDVVHDLTRFPWPFEEGEFDDLVMINVLEHLPETVRTMEEIHRIMKPDGRVTIRVPYWNSPDAISDPTHRKAFNEQSFDFFIPGTRHLEVRPYYSTAKFALARRILWVRIFGKYLRVTLHLLQLPLLFLARYLGGVIWVEEFHLMTKKDPSS
jgi:SAM-dependent methyltransferase